MAMGKVWLNAHDTAVLAQEGCLIIDNLGATYGLNIEIPDLKGHVLRGLMTHPLWNSAGSNAWVDFPSHCTDAAGETHGLWAIIRAVFPTYKPGHAVTWVADSNGRPSGKWQVTDDFQIMWMTFDVTFTDSRARFLHDMAAGAQIIGGHSDAVSTAMTEGMEAMWVWGEQVLAAALRFTDDINFNAPAAVKSMFGWKLAADAITAYQRAVGGVSNTGTIAVGHSLWSMYVDRLAVGGLVP